MVLHIAREIDLFCGYCAGLSRKPQQSPSRVVRRGVEDLVVEKDRCSDVGNTICGFAVGPHQLAIRSSKTDGSIRSYRHDRADSLDVGNDCRGVTRTVAQLLAGPYSLTGGLIQRDDSGPTTSGRDDHIVSIDKRRLAD